MYRLIGALCVALTLAACGGGETASSQPSAPAVAPGSAMPQPLLDALRGAIQPSRAYIAGSPLSTTEAFNWAETNFPSLFPTAGKVSGFLSPYTYRYYPQANMYLGVATASDDVAVFMYGAANGWQMSRIGALADFTCTIKPASCVVGANPTSLSGTTVEGGSTQLVIDAGVPPSTGTLNVSVSSATSWLTASLNGASTVNVTASAASLPAGTYQGSVTLQFVPSMGPISTKIVPVSLTVGPGLVAPAAQFLTLDAKSSIASLNGSVNIVRADGTSQPWTATSSASWLNVTSSGTTPSTLTYSVVGNSIANLTNFADHTATVTVNSPGLTPATFQVSLSKHLPFLDNVMPYGPPAGSKVRVAVHGAGFTTFTGAPTITGVTASNIKVESDTLITFDATPSAEGNYSIGIGNAAGIATGKATFKVTASSPYKAGSTAVTGNRSAYIEDPVRRSIFAVGYSENALYKYQFTGSSWTQSALPLSSPYSLGLSPDGSRLFVMLASNVVKEVNPDTMQIVATYTADYGFDNNFGDPLPATVDGRVWMPSGMRYFDLATNTFKTLPSDGYTSSYSVNAFVGAANGATVLFLPCYCTSPGYPMNQYYTKDATVSNPMGDLDLWYWTQISSDGSRVMQQWSGQVYDANYNLIGQIPNPETNEHWGFSALSPDGTRIATLVYEGNYSATYKRIDVFNTTALSPGTTRFAKVGSIPITTASAQCGYNEDNCRTMGNFFMARDGKTVFWIGNKFLQAFKMP